MDFTNSVIFGISSGKKRIGMVRIIMSSGSHMFFQDIFCSEMMPQHKIFDLQIRFVNPLTIYLHISSSGQYECL